LDNGRSNGSALIKSLKYRHFHRSRASAGPLERVSGGSDHASIRCSVAQAVEQRMSIYNHLPRMGLHRYFVSVAPLLRLCGGVIFPIRPPVFGSRRTEDGGIIHYFQVSIVVLGSVSSSLNLASNLMATLCAPRPETIPAKGTWLPSIGIGGGSGLNSSPRKADNHGWAQHAFAALQG
jgi:hypothetical protein